jgi:putative ABC transport system permease protein
MLLGEIIQVALAAIRANKLRSFLTMLGIIIGVGAVITMVALGTGAQKAVQDRIQALGSTATLYRPEFPGARDHRTRVAAMDDADPDARPSPTSCPN